MPLNPEETYVHLADNGTATSTGGGAEFWQLPPEQMSRFDQGWLLGELVCSEDWANWEMHPHGDEFVYLLSGDVELVLELVVRRGKEYASICLLFFFGTGERIRDLTKLRQRAANARDGEFRNHSELKPERWLFYV